MHPQEQLAYFIAVANLGQRARRIGRFYGKNFVKRTESGHLGTRLGNLSSQHTFGTKLHSLNEAFLPRLEKPLGRCFDSWKCSIINKNNNRKHPAYIVLFKILCALKQTVESQYATTSHKRSLRPATAARAATRFFESFSSTSESTNSSRRVKGFASRAVSVSRRKRSPPKDLTNNLFRS